MTKVIYSPETYRLKAEGHAEFGEFGSDPVCAGMTVLLSTALAALDGKDIKVHVISDEQEGVIDICAEPKTIQAGTCRTILDTIAEGIRWVAETHPEHVSFQRFIWGVD